MQLELCGKITEKQGGNFFNSAVSVQSSPSNLATAKHTHWQMANSVRRVQPFFFLHAMWNIGWTFSRKILLMILINNLITSLTNFIIERAQIFLDFLLHGHQQNSHLIYFTKSWDFCSRRLWLFYSMPRRAKNKQEDENYTCMQRILWKEWVCKAYRAWS